MSKQCERMRKKVDGVIANYCSACEMEFSVLETENFCSNCGCEIMEAGEE